MATINEIFENPKIKEVENTIAEKYGYQMSDTNQDVYKGILEREIQNSQISQQDIIKYIEANSDTIIAFAAHLLGENKGSEDEKLVPGCSIVGYTCFLIYMTEREDQLLEYINRMRIPQAKTFVKELLTIKRAMNL